MVKTVFVLYNFLFRYISFIYLNLNLSLKIFFLLFLFNFSCITCHQFSQIFISYNCPVIFSFVMILKKISSMLDLPSILIFI